MPPSAPGRISELLEEALQEALHDPDQRMRRRIFRIRVSGIVLLIAATLCIASLPFVPPGEQLVVTISLISAALAQLLVGGVLLDKAARDQLRSLQTAAGPLLKGLIGDVPSVPSEAKVQRRRFFGFGMFALAGFCACVAAMSWPHQAFVDRVMWSCFSVTLAAIGSWKTMRNEKDAICARQMSAAAKRRESAKTKSPVRRVK